MIRVSPSLSYRLSNPQRKTLIEIARTFLPVFGHNPDAEFQALRCLEDIDFTGFKYNTKLLAFIKGQIPENINMNNLLRHCLLELRYNGGRAKIDDAPITLQLNSYRDNNPISPGKFVETLDKLEMFY